MIEMLIRFHTIFIEATNMDAPKRKAKASAKSGAKAADKEERNIAAAKGGHLAVKKANYSVDVDSDKNY